MSALGFSDNDDVRQSKGAFANITQYDKKWMNHMEEQRRRLEHFLSVAKQVRAFKDVLKIKELIKELADSGKALSAPRINELQELDVMTSPYNQTLLSMLKVEN